MSRGFLPVALGCAMFLNLAVAVDLKPDERVVFFPGIGQRSADGAHWEIEIRGWIFEPEARTALLPVFRTTLGLGQLDEAEEKIFRERARLFLVDNERDKRVSIWLAGEEHKLSKSGPNGHFTSRLRILPAGVSRRLEFAGGQVHLLEPTGISVISDIDDTIKISEVADRRALLMNTFARPFQAVAGMAVLYKSWEKAGAQFHYVSASPWQLYPPLAEFQEANGFPTGTFHLKEFRWKDRSFFDLFDSPEKYKLGVIEPLLRRFPNRRFILVGDSGEKDPEIYGTLVRKYPKQIDRIFIRDVTGEAADTPRYRQAFQGVDVDRWTIFKEPDEIPTGFF
jgi:hypothetical protein